MYAWWRQLLQKHAPTEYRLRLYKLVEKHVKRAKEAHERQTLVSDKIVLFQLNFKELIPKAAEALTKEDEEKYASLRAELVERFEPALGQHIVFSITAVQRWFSHLWEGVAEPPAIREVEAMRPEEAKELSFLQFSCISSFAICLVSVFLVIADVLGFWKTMHPLFWLPIMLGSIGVAGSSYISLRRLRN